MRFFRTWKRYLVVVFGLLIVFAVFTPMVRGGSGDNVYGYAWVDGYGYLSMNCFNTVAADGSGSRTDDCSIPYGVSIASNRKLSGWSWGQSIGWVCWGEACNGQQPPGVSTPLSGYSATIASDGKVGGMGYIAMFSSGGDIELSGIANDAAQTPFGVFFNAGETSTSNTVGRCTNDDGSNITVNPGEFCGSAYNATLGWVQFRGVATNGDAYGVRSLYRSNYAPTITLFTPNSATKNVSVQPTFEWATVDPDGDPQTAAEIVVCKTAVNADCENDTTSGARILRTTMSSSAQSCTYPCGASGAPSQLDSGVQYTWKVRATDAAHPIASQPFSSLAFKTLPAVVNDAPSVSLLGPNTATKNVSHIPTFSWATVDPENDPQTAAEIVVCKKGVNPDCEDDATSGARVLRGAVADGNAQSCTYPCGASGAPAELGRDTTYTWKVRATDATHALGDQQFTSALEFVVTGNSSPSVVLLNPKVAITPEVSLTPTFYWATIDPEGDPQTAAELVVCKKGVNPNCEDDATSGARVLRGAVADGTRESCSFPCGIAGAPAALDSATAYTWKMRTTDATHPISSQSFSVAEEFRAVSANAAPVSVALSPDTKTKDVSTLPTFSWATIDPENDPQTAAEIVVCKKGVNPDCEDDSTSGARVLRGTIADGTSETCTYPCGSTTAPAHLDDETAYTWKARATDVGHALMNAAWSIAVEFTTAGGNSSPRAVPLLPNPDVAEVSLQPIFSWTVADPDGDAQTRAEVIICPAENPNCEISTPGLLPSVFRVTIDGADKSCTFPCSSNPTFVPQRLSSDTSYIWKVRATDATHSLADQEFSNGLQFKTTGSDVTNFGARTSASFAANQAPTPAPSGPVGGNVALNPTLSWNTIDPENDAQTAAEIIVCKVAINPNCENDPPTAASVALRGFVPNGATQSCVFPCGISGAPATLDYGTSYIWKVRVTDASHDIADQPFVAPSAQHRYPLIEEGCPASGTTGGPGFVTLPHSCPVASYSSTAESATVLPKVPVRFASTSQCYGTGDQVVPCASVTWNVCTDPTATSVSTCPTDHLTTLTGASPSEKISAPSCPSGQATCSFRVQLLINDGTFTVTRESSVTVGKRVTPKIRRITPF